jgi:hypothetical protein
MPRRKLTTDSNYMGLSILPEPEHGNYLNILEAIRLRMNDMIDRHCKVFGVLFGLNLPWGSGIVPDNHHVEAFMGDFCEYLRGLGIDYHYVVVREQVAPDAQPHWHGFLLMDGNRTWSFYGGHLEEAKRIWGTALGGVEGRGRVDVSRWDEAFSPTYPYVGNGGVMMMRNDPRFEQAYQLLFERASYLGKVITKQFTPKSLRKFSSSHLR